MLFAGGTIVMERDQEHNLLRDGGESALEKLIDEIHARFGDEAEFICKPPLFNIDSTDMWATHWQWLTREVAEGVAAGYDGFLITMGTNTLGYAASALTFSLLGIDKPVVITGAQVPAKELASDARNNFINSARVLIEKQLKGVIVVFGSRIINGCRAKKASESALDAFVSYNSNGIGTIGVDISIKHEPFRTQRPFQPHAVFAEPVTCVTLTPGVQKDVLQLLIDAGNKGIIIRAYGTGDIPVLMHGGLKYAREKQVPVVVTTQCPDGATMIGVNPPGQKALDIGIIPALDMSMEAMTTKLMWLLGQGLSLGEVKAMMKTNLAGEIAA